MSQPPRPIVRGFSTSSFPGDCQPPRQLRRPSGRKKRRQSEFATSQATAVIDGAVAAATSAVATVTSNILPKRLSSSQLSERSCLIDEIDGNAGALKAAVVKFSAGGGGGMSSSTPSPTLSSFASSSTCDTTDDDSDAFDHVHDIRTDPYRVVSEPDSTLPKETHPQITAIEPEEIWKFNYNEAAIYLEEGENNEKLLYHPRCDQSLSSYKYVHNRFFYALDLVAALTLLALTLFEAPAFEPCCVVGKQLHLSVELACLLVISIECWMKVRWMGFKSFITHPRTVIKVTCTILMIMDAIVAFAIDRTDFRSVRALRPVFLIDNHFCYSIRRTLRHTLQSLRPIFDIIVILFMIITVFSLLGFYLFKDYPNNKFFTSYGDTFANMFIVISNGNFPDIMMPIFSQHQTSAIFFVIYLVIQTYFILNMMLAVSYEKYSSVEREKFRRLFLHRRLCCRHAFNLLTSDAHADSLLFKHFEGVVKILKPGISRLRCYLMFKLCDTTRTGSLSLDQFYRIYDAIELNWAQEYPELRWYYKIRIAAVRNVFDVISKISRSTTFENIIDYIIISSLVFEIVKCAQIVPSLDAYSDVLYTIFISIYVVEAVMKMCTYGIVDYITVGWNAYDFLVAGVSMVGFYIQPLGYSFGYFYILRTFRILRLFQKTQRYQHIMGPFVFILLRQMTHFCVIVFVVLYSFSIIGMELFAVVDRNNPPPSDITTSTMDDLYRLHNFADFPSAFLLLLILSFTYLWSFVMERYAKLVSSWSRVYFIFFYVISTVVMKIVVSSILEAFLFVMKCKRRLADIQDQTRITRDIKLTEAELVYLELGMKEHPLSRANGYHHKNQYKYAKAIFRGRKLRTKFSFSCKMYDAEIKQWIEEEEASEKLAEQAKQARRRRAYSCKV